MRCVCPVCRWWVRKQSKEADEAQVRRCKEREAEEEGCELKEATGEEECNVGVKREV